MKECKGCGELKELGEYYKYSKYPNTYHPYCKPCARAMSRIQSAEYYAKNRAKVLARTRAYKKKNADKMRAWHAQHAREKRHTDLNFRLAHNLRKRISNYIAESRKEKRFIKPKSVIECLGCTTDELIKHIESLWTEGMSWKNYGSAKNGKWEIDHIVPLSSFDLGNLRHFKKAAHYSNLQPLWRKHNRAKSNHLEYNAPKSVPHLK